MSIDTGLRQAELLGLRWPDIDFEGRTLTVRETLQRVDREYVLGPPKSETSCRTVALSDLSLKALRDEREAQIAARQVASRRCRETIPGLVFTTSLGAPRNGSSLTHALQKALHATGLRPLRWHDLRASTAASWSRPGGMTTARDRLGHSSIAVTSTF
ncbi:phage integrase, partial [mine drainage metagenome]